ncbi:MAG: hypothetical protein ACJA1C_000099 [Crocinitomicaceae bacterium]|jgi:hypothetical protein
MKNALLFCFLALTSLGFSQDNVVLRDGRIKHVEITEVNEKEGLLYYVRGKKTLSYSLEDVLEYEKDGQVYSKNLKSDKFEKQVVSSYKTYSTFFKRPPKFEYSPYSISASFGMPFSNRYQSTAIDLFFTVNPRISIEPEYRFVDWFSLKMPVVFGLNTQKDVIETNGLTSEFGYFDFKSPYTDPGDREDHYGVVYNYVSHNNYNSQSPELGSYYGSYGRGAYQPGLHTRELKFQIGLAPKIYPMRGKMFSFYFSPSIHFGIGNYNQVDYFANFVKDPYTNTDGVLVESWNLIDEDVISTPIDFSYWKVEILTGIDFNVTKNINFGYEIGFGSKELNPVGAKDDKIYMSLDGAEPELLATYPFISRVGFDWASGYVINRFLLVYKFGGKKIEQ